MNSVLVLLSTYNGEKYLRDQLDSLYRQRDVDVHILVRDDGSQDKTTSVLDEYRNTYGKMTLIKEPNLGSKRSFYRLVQLSYEMNFEYDYYAFCDQDDVWDDDKLVTAVRALEQIDSPYKLYYCNPSLVDADLSPMQDVDCETEQSLVSTIISSHSLGCTQVMNKLVLRQMMRINSHMEMIEDDSYLPQHDTWAVITTRSLNGVVYYDKGRHIKYRQHQSNVVGGGSKNAFITFKTRFKRHYNKPNHRSRLAGLTYKIYGGDIHSEAWEDVYLMANYRDSILARLALFFSSRIKTGNLSIDMPMKLMIILGYF